MILRQSSLLFGCSEKVEHLGRSFWDLFSMMSTLLESGIILFTAGRDPEGEGAEPGR